MSFFLTHDPRRKLSRGAVMFYYYLWVCIPLHNKGRKDLKKIHFGGIKIVQMVNLCVGLCRNSRRSWPDLRELCICLPIYISVANNQGFKNPHLCASETSRNHLLQLHHFGGVHMKIGEVMFTRKFCLLNFVIYVSFYSIFKFFAWLNTFI